MPRKEPGEGGSRKERPEATGVEAATARVRGASEAYDQIHAALEKMGGADEGTQEALALFAEGGLSAEDREAAMDLLRGQNELAADLQVALDQVGDLIEAGIKEQGSAVEEARLAEARLAHARAQSAAREATLAQLLVAKRLEEARELSESKEELVISEGAAALIEDFFASHSQLAEESTGPASARLQRALDAGTPEEQAMDQIGQELLNDAAGVGHKKAFTSIPWSASR